MSCFWMIDGEIETSGNKKQAAEIVQALKDFRKDGYVIETSVSADGTIAFACDSMANYDLPDNICDVLNDADGIVGGEFSADSNDDGGMHYTYRWEDGEFVEYCHDDEDDDENEDEDDDEEDDEKDEDEFETIEITVRSVSYLTRTVKISRADFDRLVTGSPEDVASVNEEISRMYEDVVSGPDFVSNDYSVTNSEGQTIIEFDD